MSNASSRALRSIAADASRMRLGSRSTKERPADLTIIFGPSGTSAGAEDSMYAHDGDKELPGSMDDDEDEE